MFRSSTFTLVANHLATPTEQKDPPIVYEYTPYACKAIMNRPKTLNAGSLDMIQNIRRELKKWNQNPDLKVVLVIGKGVAFSAGGDLKYVYEAKFQPTKEQILDEFWREVYTCFWETATMKAIQIVLWDGIVMGGGVGVSIHAPIRIATEKCVFAMPEARLGSFTDCTSSYFFSRLRNNLGYFLALTGTRLKGAEVVQVGLANYFVQSKDLKELQEEILKTANPNTTLEDVKTIIKKYKKPVTGKTKYDDFANKYFGKGSVEEIYKALQETNEDKELAKHTLDQLNLQCPTSLKVVHELIKRGKDLSVKESFNLDLRINANFMKGNDFFEGIRCTLVDRKDKPVWTYKSVEDVPQEEVEKYFIRTPGFRELIE